MSTPIMATAKPILPWKLRLSFNQNLASIAIHSGWQIDKREMSEARLSFSARDWAIWAMQNPIIPNTAIG